MFNISVKGQSVTVTMADGTAITVTVERPEAAATPEPVVEAQQPEPARRQLSELLSPFWQWGECPHIQRLLAEGRSIGERHAKERRRLWERHILPHEICRKNADDVTVDDLFSLREDLLEQTGRRSVQQAMAGLKTAFKELFIRGRIAANPFDRYTDMSHKNRETGAFTADESQRLFATSEPWGNDTAYALFLVAFGTGMRRGEILALRWSDIDLEQRSVRVERAFKDEQHQVGPPKWGKTREEPLMLAAVEALRRLYGPGDPERLVFSHPDGTRYSGNWWQKRFAAACRSIGITDEERQKRALKPHSLRHTFITILRGQVEDSLLQDLVGHTDIRTTNQYTHVTVEHKRRAADVMDGVLSGFGQLGWQAAG